MSRWLTAIEALYGVAARSASSGNDGGDSSGPDSGATSRRRSPTKIGFVGAIGLAVAMLVAAPGCGASPDDSGGSKGSCSNLFTKCSGTSDCGTCGLGCLEIFSGDFQCTHPCNTDSDCKTWKGICAHFDTGGWCS
jgi:hypothetical protein